jgi:hypothetical protein
MPSATVMTFGVRPHALPCFLQTCAAQAGRVAHNKATDGRRRGRLRHTGLAHAAQQVPAELPGRPHCQPSSKCRSSGQVPRICHASRATGPAAPLRAKSATTPAVLPVEVGAEGQALPAVGRTSIHFPPRLGVHPAVPDWSLTAGVSCFTVFSVSAVDTAAPAAYTPLYRGVGATMVPNSESRLDGGTRWARL